jgi:hypothetical protein
METVHVVDAGGFHLARAVLSKHTADTRELPFQDAVQCASIFHLVNITKGMGLNFANGHHILAPSQDMPIPASARKPSLQMFFRLWTSSSLLDN